MRGRHPWHSAGGVGRLGGVAAHGGRSRGAQGREVVATGGRRGRLPLAQARQDRIEPRPEGANLGGERIHLPLGWLLRGRGRHEARRGE